MIEEEYQEGGLPYGNSVFCLMKNDADIAILPTCLNFYHSPDKPKLLWSDLPPWRILPDKIELKEK